MENLNLEKFNPKLEQLRVAVEKSKLIVDVDIDDAEQLANVKKTRIELRDIRIEITETGKELRSGALAFQKAVIDKEDELVEMVKPEEVRLKAIEERVKERKEMARRLAILPQRREKTQSILPEIVLTDEKLLALDDDQFGSFINELIANKNETDRLANEKKEKELQDSIDKFNREKEMEAAKEQARKDEREKFEQEEKDKKEKADRDAKEKADKEESDRLKKLADEKADKEQLERSEKYIKFLADHSYDGQSDLFKIEKDGNIVRLFKLIGEINLDQ